MIHRGQHRSGFLGRAPSEASALRRGVGTQTSSSRTLGGSAMTRNMNVRKRHMLSLFIDAGDGAGGGAVDISFRVDVVIQRTVLKPTRR